MELKQKLPKLPGTHWKLIRDYAVLLEMRAIQAKISRIYLGTS